MKNILEVSQVDQCFRTGFWMRRTRILHEVSLAVPERSVFGFLGANGAGKTTLIQLVVGLRRPTAGTVTVAGFGAHTPQARSRIGYLPERPYFYEHLTGEGFLRYFGALSGMGSRRLASRIPEALAAVGMSHARSLELRRYSKGMLQRIGIAQAILHDPEFLVLDEPMSGLDPVGRKEMRELITKLASEGRTVFFSSHVIPDVEALCDRVALIQKGRIIGCGPIAGFLSQGETPVEISLTGADPGRVRALPGVEAVRELSDGLRATLGSQRDVDRALRALLEMRATIQSVTPVRPSLESFFERSAV